MNGPRCWPTNESPLKLAARSRESACSSSESLYERLAGWIALPRGLRQHFDEHCRHPPRDGWVELRRRRRRRRELVVNNAQRIFRLKRRPPSQHLVHHDPERVQIGATVGVVAASLL